MSGKRCMDLSDGHKVCSKCKSYLPLDSFGRRKTGNGVRPACKVCCFKQKKAWRQRNPERGRRYTKQWRKRYPEKRRVQALKEYYRNPKRLYGVTNEQWRDMLAQQEGKCAICGSQDRERLTVDHCHVSRKVRSLLCRNCNAMLGMAHEKSSTLQAAIVYLEQWK